MPISLTGIFRDNVAALVLRGDGKILIGECSDKPGTWGFPQGGVDDGETRREALTRELREEVGLRPADYKVVGSRSGYAYEYPEGHLKKGIYCGQIQTYFLCLLRGRQPNHLGGNQKIPEFLRLRWVSPDAVNVQSFPSFKQDVTRRVLEDFFPSKGSKPSAHSSDSPSSP